MAADEHQFSKAGVDWELDSPGQGRFVWEEVAVDVNGSHLALNRVQKTAEPLKGLECGFGWAFQLGECGGLAATVSPFHQHGGIDPACWSWATNTGVGIWQG